MLASALVLHPLLWAAAAPAARHLARGLGGSAGRRSRGELSENEPDGRRCRAGLASPVQQAALLYPPYLLQHTAGWLLLLAAAPHVGDPRSQATLLGLLQLARCCAFRADDQWLLKLVLPAKAVEAALAFEDEHQLQMADAVARQAADWLGLSLAYLVLYVRRAGLEQAALLGVAQGLPRVLAALMVPRAAVALLGMLVRWRFYAVAYERHWQGWRDAARCCRALLPLSALAVLPWALVGCA